MNQNIGNYEQILTTIIGGYLGALLPNKLSNIPHLMMAMIIGSLFSKIIYGDFDKGFQFTKSDILYWIVTFIEALVGGTIALWIRSISY